MTPMHIVLSYYLSFLICVLIMYSFRALILYLIIQCSDIVTDFEFKDNCILNIDNYTDYATQSSSY